MQDYTPSLHRSIAIVFKRQAHFRKFLKILEVAINGGVVIKL